MKVLLANVQMAHLSLSTFSLVHQFVCHGLEQDRIQVDVMNKKPKTFTSTGKLREICMEQNSRCAFFVENVKLHPAMADQAER